MKSRSNKVNKKRNTTSKNRKLLQFSNEIVVKFLVLLNTIKLYHWKTYSYSTHKATDELYEKLNKNIDTFVEVLLGKQGNRVQLQKIRTIPLYSYSTSNELHRYLVDFKSYLVDLDQCPTLIGQGMSNSDLFNIRDEIMADINQFLYLLTFIV